jgi:hypothetical protein
MFFEHRDVVIENRRHTHKISWQVSDVAQPELAAAKQFGFDDESNPSNPRR